MTACMTGLDLDWSGRLVEVMDWRWPWTGGGHGLEEVEL